LRVHPGARLSLRILGVESSGELGMVIAAAGLASNLAALRALATEGIQRGHMSLHARSVAVAAGARGEFVDRVAAELSSLGDIRAERAVEILARLQST
jgi:hydroxymethylglutaryl-CoA reductase